MDCFEEIYYNSLIAESARLTVHSNLEIYALKLHNFVYPYRYAELQALKMRYHRLYAEQTAWRAVNNTQRDGLADAATRVRQKEPGALRDYMRLAVKYTNPWNPK